MTDARKAAAALRDAHAAFEAGRTEAAARGFQAVLQDDPENLEAHYFLAAIAHRDGQSADALAAVDRAIALRPDSADCHNLRGLSLMALGRHEDACAALRHAMACEPGFADAANNLGAALEAMGDMAQAETAYRAAIDRDAAYAQAHANLSRVLLATGRPADAEAACRRALALQPGLADARFNLAVAQQRQGAYAEAEETVEGALAAASEDAGLWRFLGVLRHGRADLDGAESALRRALELQPSLPEAHDNLAGVYLDQGQADAAETSFRKALALDPKNSRTHSNLLLCRNYTETDPAALFAAHRGWAAQHGTHIAPLPPVPRREPTRLRVGFVSGDFRRHSVAFFFEPLLRHRDRTRFETVCYANLENPDAVTTRLKRLSDQWRWVAGFGDDRLAETIRNDQVDILVDLSGHTAGNRLPVFARRPAPVQATWLGYPNTTGLDAIDYRITDAVADPEDGDRFATETLLRLPDGFLCFGPPDEAPPVAPAQPDRPLAFGSFNNLRKITPETIETWSEILRRTTPSTLFLKARPLADPATAARFRALFEAQGVDPARLAFRGAVAAPSEHLASYGEVDIALDPFPYNGTTTTCEALWMGVPVVTLAGNRHAGRVGASLLAQLGLTDNVAKSRESYVTLACTLARDRDALASAREGLRERMAQSSLCDGPGFCRRMEAAFERMRRERGAD